MTRPSLLVAAVAVLVSLAACGQPADPPADNRNSGQVLNATETSQDFGDYVVHFNALSTTELDPKIAREYGIVRSKSRAMLTVTILKKRENGKTTAVPGSVATSLTNLTGQFRKMPMREIREGDAIYYIGEMTFTNAETVIFTIDVTPINDPSRYTIHFMKQFFTD